jgi:rfaE bifunctional protein nucleotidyltransferase chain/domain
MNRLVLTCGSFDVLHIGHVRYLQQARALGDALVVAINSDESVRALEGYGRPVNPAEERAAVVAALSCVDKVFVFGDLSPERIIEAVRPDIFVKGGDFRGHQLPEAGVVEAYGGRVVIVPLWNGGRSATASGTTTSTV